MPLACAAARPSLAHIPEARDSERPKPYVPRNHYRTHPSFPQAPASQLEQPSMFEKFDVDLLFFIFYFQQVWRHSLLPRQPRRVRSVSGQCLRVWVARWC